MERHVAPGLAVPLHPEAAAFAGHYGFDIDVLAAYQPTRKGRVERQVANVRDHVLAGRSFDSLTQLQAAFDDWLPSRRAQVLDHLRGSALGFRNLINTSPGHCSRPAGSDHGYTLKSR